MKPCMNPRCQSAAYVASMYRENGIAAYGECLKCGVRGPTATCNVRADDNFAIAASRAEAEAEAERLWDALPRGDVWHYPPETPEVGEWVLVAFNGTARRMHWRCDLAVFGDRTHYLELHNVTAWRRIDWPEEDGDE